MGCGSSSLKGDDVPNVNSQPVDNATGLQPMKKVKTNFSDINYEQDAHGRRMTEYAPDQSIAAPVREESFSAAQLAAGQQQQQRGVGTDGIMPDRPDLNASNAAAYPHGVSGPGPHATVDDAGDTSLKPYQTIDGEDWDANDPAATRAINDQPYTNGTNGTNGEDLDPTSSSAKQHFAEDNDPSQHNNQQQHHHSSHDGSQYLDANENNNYNGSGVSPSSETGSDGRKKSWLGQKYAGYQAAKRGTGPSDEDVLKYTGKERGDLVGGGDQSAGRVGTDNGIAAGAAWS